MKRVLFLDLSSHTGWAVDQPGGGDKPLTGVVHLPMKGEIEPAFVFFEDWLTDMIAVHKPDAGGFEAPLMPRGSNFITTEQTVRLLFGLAAYAGGTFERHGVESFEVNVATVKKHFAGHGRAEKRDILQRCRLLGWSVTDHNAADAAAGWDFVRHKLRAPNLTAGPLYGGRA